jgi:AraC-like DNA-binding protein
MPQRKASQSAGKNLEALPSAVGVLSRLAAERLVQSGINLEPLFQKAGVPVTLPSDKDVRVSVRSQIDFLNLAANALDDPLLGFHLARDSDLREIGPLYYAMASSETLGDAINHAARYSAIVNEGMRVVHRGTNAFTVEFEYVGVERHPDRHQIEFWVTCTLRIIRLLTNRELTPTYVGFLHWRDGDVSEIERYFASTLNFGAVKDRISFAPHEADLPIITSDPYLNRILFKHYEEISAQQERRHDPLRTRIENAISPLLPHGGVSIGAIASALGMSARTLSRRLAEENLTFSTILEDLRSDLADQYLQNNDLSISQIAWLLGYTEVSSFAHAFQRWTGKSPTDARKEIKKAARTEESPSSRNE